MRLPSTVDGRVVAVSISDRKGIKKHNVNAVKVLDDYGLADAPIPSTGIARSACWIPRTLPPRLSAFGSYRGGAV